MNEQVQPSADVMAMMRYDANKKSTGLAYVLWFFLGGFGVHRFYLGSPGVGILLVICTLLGFVVGVTFIVTVLVCLWDLFAIPGMVRRNNQLAAANAGLPAVFS